MIIYTAEDLALEDLVTKERSIANVSDSKYFTGDIRTSDDTSIGHFCDFVDFYTRHATNPMCTALTCEKQAEAIRITQQDLCPETIQLLLETLLTAIDHLEKKWLDEQIQREEQIYSAQIPAKPVARQSGKYEIKHLWQTGKHWTRKWFTSQNKRASRNRSVRRRHIPKDHIAQKEIPV